MPTEPTAYARAANSSPTASPAGSPRARVRELAERLALEYAGAVPPGQVLALVFRADRNLTAARSLSPEGRLMLCESVVRRSLTDALALAGSTARPA